MNDSTIRLSADTSALTDALGKIAEEMTAMKDAVSSSAAAMGENLDASAKQAEAADAAMHGLDERRGLDEVASKLSFLRATMMISD